MALQPQTASAEVAHYLLEEKCLISLISSLAEGLQRSVSVDTQSASDSVFKIQNFKSRNDQLN